MYRLGGNVSKTWVKTVGFTRPSCGRVKVLYRAVYEFTHFATPSPHNLYTFFTQVEDREMLCIEALPNSIYLFTNHIVELNFFFNLLNRVNGGSVVFATKLTSDLREA